MRADRSGQTPFFSGSRECPAPDGVTATDPVSASPNHPIVTFAMPRVDQRAGNVPTRSVQSLAERDQEDRGPFCRCPTEFLRTFHRNPELCFYNNRNRDGGFDSLLYF